MNDVADDGPTFKSTWAIPLRWIMAARVWPLGDTAAAEQKYKDQLPYFNIVSGSSPIYLVPGNHEQQEAWHLLGHRWQDSLPVMGKNAEKKYFLNPVPDVLLHRRYGHVFLPERRPVETGLLCLDVGRCALRGDQSLLVHDHQTVHNLDRAAVKRMRPASGDRWDWTLGLTQFNWLKTTLQNSTAKYKFVFAHQIVGGNSLQSRSGELRAWRRGFRQPGRVGRLQRRWHHLGVGYQPVRMGEPADPPDDGGERCQRLLPRPRSPVCL